MKILLVQDCLRSGGTERQTILLANAFAAAGHATSLLTFRPGGTLAATVAPDVRRAALQPFDLGLDWFAPGLISYARRLAPDIVLCMGRMANCHGARLQAALPGTAVVATMRTGKPLPALYRRSLHRARAVVANSRDARDTLIRDYALPAEKIAVIHNSLVFASAATTPTASSTGASADSRAQLRAQHGAGPATNVLLCVAMFRAEKNQRELIELAATLPPTLDWQLWLAGDGPARAACEALAAAKGLTARIRFLGLVRDPSSLYAAADIAVHASHTESLSNFLIEAQDAGLPVVAYAAQGIAETFQPDRTGWLIPGDDRAAFAARVTALAALSADDRRSLATAAHAYARATFDHDRQVAAYLGLFSRLTNSTDRHEPPASRL